MPLCYEYILTTFESFQDVHDLMTVDDSFVLGEETLEHLEQTTAFEN